MKHLQYMLKRAVAIILVAVTANGFAASPVSHLLELLTQNNFGRFNELWPRYKNQLKYEDLRLLFDMAENKLNEGLKLENLQLILEILSKPQDPALTVTPLPTRPSASPSPTISSGSSGSSSSSRPIVPASAPEPKIVAKYTGPKKSDDHGNGYFVLFYPGGPIDGEIQARFYHSDRPFYEFTNFWSAPFQTPDRRLWPTTEHYFQAHKFHDFNIQEKIRAAHSPGDAFELARQYPNDVRKDWDSAKDGIMLTAVRAKFNAHPKLRQLLLFTDQSALRRDPRYNATLIEATDGPHTDIYWGVNNNTTPFTAKDGKVYMPGQGYNRLGTILMHVREELKTNNFTNNRLPPVESASWY